VYRRLSLLVFGYASRTRKSGGLLCWLFPRCVKRAPPVSLDWRAIQLPEQHHRFSAVGGARGSVSLSVKGRRCEPFVPHPSSLPRSRLSNSFASYPIKLKIRSEIPDSAESSSAGPKEQNCELDLSFFLFSLAVNGLNCQGAFRHTNRSTEPAKNPSFTLAISPPNKN
jgi:hypothetical protein